MLIEPNNSHVCFKVLHKYLTVVKLALCPKEMQNTTQACTAKAQQLECAKMPVPMIARPLCLVPTKSPTQDFSFLPPSLLLLFSRIQLKKACMQQCQGDAPIRGQQPFTLPKKPHTRLVGLLECPKNTPNVRCLHVKALPALLLQLWRYWEASCFNGIHHLILEIPPRQPPIHGDGTQQDGDEQELRNNKHQEGCSKYI